MKIGLVAAEFAVMLAVLVIGKLHPRLAKFPAVNREGIFAQVGQSDGAHLLQQHFTGFEFRSGTGGTVTEH